MRGLFGGDFQSGRCVVLFKFSRVYYIFVRGDYKEFFEELEGSKGFFGKELRRLRGRNVTHVQEQRSVDYTMNLM